MESQAIFQTETRAFFLLNRVPAVLVVMPAADGEVAPDVESLGHRHGRRLVAVHGDGQEVAAFHHLHLLRVMM